MEQIDIMFQRRSETSKDAARRIESSAATLRARVLKYLNEHPSGATDDEIQEGLVMEGSTERPRRIELQRMGMVIDSGTRRQTRSGRSAVVWMAA